MALSSLSSFLFPIFFILITKAIAQPPSFRYHFCINDNGNYTNSSAYKTNLNNLLSALPTNSGNGYGFYNLSRGTGPDTVNAIGLCRGDVGHDDCRSCLDNATLLLPTRCPNQMEAVGWYDFCMLRYSNRSIFNTNQEDQMFTIWNPNNVSSSDAAEFYKVLRDLLNDLKNQAAWGGPLLKFKTGKASGPRFINIYALVQCTPDLSQQDCNNCLDDTFRYIPACCDGLSYARSRVVPSCYYWYDTQLFYNETADVPSPPPPIPTVSSPPPNTNATTQGNGSNKSKTFIIVVVSSAVVSAVIIASLCVCLRMRKKKKKTETLPLIYDPVEEIETPESLQFNFETIRVATNDFSEANKLGQGGFGPVYKGRLSNGREIAVKRLSTGSGQGDLEFKNEVMLVAKLQHRNLVRLLGFCLERSERLLIYEFVANASLDHFIFDPSKRPCLDWERRYKIIGGIARGLLYLHEDSRLRIIHRDLKASNILLDEEMHPKISDFGMARLFHVDQTQGNTSRIVGTYGYMAPEYVMHGQFSVRSDVYSFGVLLLEIVSGQKNNCFRHGEHVEDLLSFAWRSWRDQTTSNIVDPLVGHGPGSDIIRCIHIALLCVQENVANRPTMNTVVLMLSSNSLSLPVPSEPAFFMRSNIESDMTFPSNFNSRVTNESDHSKSESAQAFSTNEASITELYPR